MSAKYELLKKPAAAVGFKKRYTAPVLKAIDGSMEAPA